MDKLIDKEGEEQEKKEEKGGREARTKAGVQTCGESNGYLVLNLNCRMNCSPSYKVPSGPLRWIFQLHRACVCVGMCISEHSKVREWE